MKPTEAELRCILFAQKFLPKPKKYFWHKLIPKFRKVKKPQYNVSYNKSFKRLWMEFGLYSLQGYETKKPKMECINYWLEQLYPFKIDIKLILNEIDESQAEHMDEAFIKDPTLICLLMVEPIDVLPEEIDKKFGKYDNFLFKIITQTIPTKENYKLS